MNCSFWSWKWSLRGIFWEALPRQDLSIDHDKKNILDKKKFKKYPIKGIKSYRDSYIFVMIIPCQDNQNRLRLQITLKSRERTYLKQGSRKVLTYYYPINYLSHGYFYFSTHSSKILPSSGYSSSDSILHDLSYSRSANSFECFSGWTRLIATCVSDKSWSVNMPHYLTQRKSHEESIAIPLH